MSSPTALRPTAPEFVAFVRSLGDKKRGATARAELRRVCREAQRWLDANYPGSGLRAQLVTVEGTGDRAVGLVEIDPDAAAPRPHADPFLLN